ncbi:hypothetical protein BDZ89DRAFT_1062394 [Hymenopellis radicata]|nr:hypothetical protein BDZ89DRAFT_1062394 [Hymenopellis radicata]
MDTTNGQQPHPQLVVLQAKLQAIHDAIADFHPPARRLPILDSSLNIHLEQANSSRAEVDVQIPPVAENGLEQSRGGRDKRTEKENGRKEAKESAGFRDEWTVQGHISGLKKLKDTIKIDLDALDRFLQSPTSSTVPPLSTNAPYLIAVWNEVLAAQHNGGVKAVFKSFLLDGDERIGEDEDQDHDSDGEADASSKAAPNTGRRAKGKKSNGKPKGSKDQDRKKTKIDVVAEGGTSWIRVNTIKNSRLLSEFREIDSYLTESDSEAEDELGHEYGNRPSLAQKVFDNSILRMGRALVETAKNNTLRVGKIDQRIVPRITLRLTRLDPEEPDVDGRIAETIRLLQNMGLIVEIGERAPPSASSEPNPLSTSVSAPSSSTPPSSLKPTHRINLDLSVLIALTSDLTHAPLPASVAEAKERYVPPPAERDWKKLLGLSEDKDRKTPLPPLEDDDEDEDGVDKELKEKRRKQREDELLQHSRALTTQVLQEMGKGMINEIRDRLRSTVSSLDEVEFWTTVEARDRCLRIVSKIAGEHEKKRVRALFDGDVKAYWAGSRYSDIDGKGFIPIMPLHYYDDNMNIVHVDGQEDRAPFFHALERTCVEILGEDGTGGADPHPIYAQESTVSGRAVPTKYNPRLTGHTVRTLLWGAKRGWTTITANRTSVRAVVKEVGRGTLGGLGGSLDNAGVRQAADTEERAAIWIVDPRSLAEGMRSDLIDTENV